MDYKRFLKLVARKIKPHELNEREISKLSLVSKKYSFDLLKQCVDIAVAQYFDYDCENVLKRSSVDNLVEKIGGIAYTLSLPKVDQEILRLKSWGRKKFWREWDDARADKILSSIKKSLLSGGLKEEELSSPFEKALSYRLRDARCFEAWCREMRDWRKYDMPKYIEECTEGKLDDLPWQAS